MSGSRLKMSGSGWESVGISGGGGEWQWVGAHFSRAHV